MATSKSTHHSANYQFVACFLFQKQEALLVKKRKTNTIKGGYEMVKVAKVKNIRLCRTLNSAPLATVKHFELS